MAVVSMYMYDPRMLIQLDEGGCDRHHSMQKYAYSIKGMPLCDHRILCRGKQYSIILIMLIDGIHDVYITEGAVDREKFTDFMRDYLLSILLPFNNVNPYSVVIMDNASIHHVCEVKDLIVNQAGARLCYLPPYSPDLMPAEGILSQVKSIMKENHQLFQVCSAPRVLLVMAFGMVSVENMLWPHLKIHLNTANLIKLDTLT